MDHKGEFMSRSSLEKSVFVALSGGLGNQLFQLAAGLSVAKDNPVVLVSSFLSSRQWLAGRPDVAGFQLPPNVFLHGARLGLKRPNSLTRAGAGFMLRSGLVPNRWDSRPILRNTAARITSLMAAKHLGCRCPVMGATGHGYDSKLETCNPPVLLVGYFQTWKYAADQSVKQSLVALVPESQDAWITQMKDLAEIEHPLIVHVRLGDYRDDASFGIPGQEYYREAFDRLSHNGDHRRVWLFSDEPEFALQHLPSEIRKTNPRMIHAPKTVDPSGVLEVMRSGKAYILTNSTFGYWSAYLSRSSEPLVTIPDPWFTGFAPFTDFAPPTWLTLPGSHQ